MLLDKNIFETARELSGGFEELQRLPTHPRMVPLALDLIEASRVVAQQIFRY